MFCRYSYSILGAPEWTRNIAITSGELLNGPKIRVRREDSLTSTHPIFKSMSSYQPPGLQSPMIIVGKLAGSAPLRYPSGVLGTEMGYCWGISAYVSLMVGGETVGFLHCHYVAFFPG